MRRLRRRLRGDRALASRDALQAGGGSPGAPNRSGQLKGPSVCICVHVFVQVSEEASLGKLILCLYGYGATVYKPEAGSCQDTREQAELREDALRL